MGEDYTDADATEDDRAYETRECLLTLFAQYGQQGRTRRIERRGDALHILCDDPSGIDRELIIHVTVTITPAE